MATSNKRHNILIIGLSVLICAVIWGVFIYRSKNQHALSYTVFEGPRGWGYDILVDSQVYIHQEHMPALAGTNGFASKEQATKTAVLLVQKIVNGDQPTVTPAEVQAICQCQ